MDENKRFYIYLGETLYKSIQHGKNSVRKWEKFSDEELNKMTFRMKMGHTSTDEKWMLEISQEINLRLSLKDDELNRETHKVAGEAIENEMKEAPNYIEQSESANEMMKAFTQNPGEFEVMSDDGQENDSPAESFPRSGIDWDAVAEKLKVMEDYDDADKEMWGLLARVQWRVSLRWRIK
jgi:hypothetical protein